MVIFIKILINYSKLNKHKRRINEENRRSRIKESGGILSKDISSKLYKLQKGKCACCGIDLNQKYHLDHILPLALGGMNVDSNIQLLSPRCNLKKGKKNPIDYMQANGYLI